MTTTTPSTTPPSASITASTSALLRWRLRHGGQARCLVRLRILDGAHPLPEALRPRRENADLAAVATIAVVSQLADTEPGQEILADFAGLAQAAVGLVPAVGAVSEVVWLAHHGPFSTPDHTGEPETLTRVDLSWNGQTYLPPAPADHRLITGPAREDVTALLRLEPVADVLSTWSWGRGGAGISRPTPR